MHISRHGAARLGTRTARHGTRGQQPLNMDYQLISAPGGRAGPGRARGPVHGARAAATPSAVLLSWYLNISLRDSSGVLDSHWSGCTAPAGGESAKDVAWPAPLPQPASPLPSPTLPPPPLPATERASKRALEYNRPRERVGPRTAVVGKLPARTRTRTRTHPLALVARQCQRVLLPPHPYPAPVMRRDARL